MAVEGLGRLEADGDKLKDLLLQEKKANVRTAMAFALAASNHNEYINDLANALDSRQDYQAHMYLYELGRFDGKLEDLHRYLRSTNPKVRAGMAKVLGDIGNPSSREPIQALTQDNNVEVLREATTALRKLSAR